MRFSPVVFALALAAASPVFGGSAQAADGLDAARYFDQLGVRAYAEGRWVDAKGFFRAALEAGGPATELWNIAKCDLQIGDARAAVQGLVLYLDRDDLGADDRREAEKLLAEVQKRPSTLSVATAESGATVKVDDRLVGITPVTTTVAPGEHHVRIERLGGSSDERTIVAENGTAIALTADVASTTTTDRPPPPPPHKSIKRVGIELLPIGITVGFRGDADKTFSFTPAIGVTYTFLAGRRALFGAGLRLALALDRWSTSANVPNTAAGCTLPADYNAAELMAHPFLFGAVRLTPSIDLGARAGFGLAGYASASELGGDYFEPGCDVSTGLRGDFFGALDLSFQLRPFRILIEPLTVNVHSGYGGARSAPFDTTGIWARLGGSIGVAVDL